MIFSSLIKKEEYLETESRFNRYFSSREELEETDSSNEAYSNISLTASRHINSFLSLKEEDKDKDTFSLFFFDETKNELLSPSKEKEKEKKIFNIEYKKKNSIFTQTEKDLQINDEAFLKKKRSTIRRSRKENQDNIRKKIKRGFLNNALVKNLNETLKKIGSKLFFEKFPQNLVGNVNKNSNKEIINMTLLEIFEKKELCNEKDLDNYYHNLKVVKNKEIQENEELKKILNKKYCELFEDYLNSKEFKIDEINRLKEKNMDDEYIERYIYLSKHFIEFFSD
jgi:hypothetical protein